MGLALAAMALWALLAALGVALAHVPPFLLTGLALLMGSLVALPLAGYRRWRKRVGQSRSQDPNLNQKQTQGKASEGSDPGRRGSSSPGHNPDGKWGWQMPWLHWALGVYGLFGFHFLLFMALRHAPPVQANLVNYLWPLGMVVMAPLFLPDVRLKARHLLAAALGFAGACLAILSKASGAVGAGLNLAWADSAWGYLCALGSAFIWASYSLMSRRQALQGKGFSDGAMAWLGAASGLLALLCHVALEPPVALSVQDGLYLALMGLGPLGAAFYLWDAALKRGDVRQIGILSNITPLASTVVLILVTAQAMTWLLAAAAALIVAAAVLGLGAD